MTKINNEEIILNSDLIESISQTPDTIILLTSGKTILVKESLEEIIEKTVHFRKRIYQKPDTYEQKNEE